MMFKWEPTSSHISAPVPVKICDHEAIDRVCQRRSQVAVRPGAHSTLAVAPGIELTVGDHSEDIRGSIAIESPKRTSCLRKLEVLTARNGELPPYESHHVVPSA
jgi:hypothetical protein